MFGGLVGGLIGGISNAIIQRRQNKQANKLELENWHRQNAYNDPQEQMRRLKEAGLNPNLVYGGSPGQVSGSADSIGVHKTEKPNIEFPNLLQNNIMRAQLNNTRAQTDNLGMQSEVIAQDAALRAAQTVETLARVRKTNLENRQFAALLQTSIDAAKFNLEKSKTDNVLNIGRFGIEKTKLEMEQTKLPVELEKMAEEIKSIKATTTGTDLTNQLKTMENELAKLGIYPNSPYWSKIMSRAGIDIHKWLQKNRPNFFKF